MATLNELKTAGRVRGTLQVIQKRLAEEKLAETRPKLKQLSSHWGISVLQGLPSNVREFQYSQEYPEIRAERESGTESWDAEMAFQWAFDVEAGTEGRIPLNKG